MSKRLAYLEKITSEGSKDPFAWYGLALEYKTLGRVDDALRTFEALRASTPDYVPMYLMCGQMLADASRPEARAWLEAGVAVAREKRDSHALGELEAALDGLSSS
ncbi:MAG TPA: tetratricopeptide repeat protein [Polyangiaceae bacterium]